MVLPIVSVLIGISLVYYIRQRKAEKEMDEIVSSLPQPSDNSQPIGTRDLCLELLRQLNCEVRIEHDDIYFTYQNEKFMIEASNESAFITIWDLHWDMVDSENIQDVENENKKNCFNYMSKEKLSLSKSSCNYLEAANTAIKDCVGQQSCNMKLDMSSVSCSPSSAEYLFLSYSCYEDEVKIGFVDSQMARTLSPHYEEK